MLKLAIHDFSRTELGYYLAEPLSAPVAAATAAPSHHIMCIDRSGSMYGAISDTRTMVEKLLTLTEFRDPNQRISLISYSSRGDVRLHFQRVTVEDVMAASSPYVKEIRSLASSGLTCISQSLGCAANVVVPGEVTMVTLHSDGYANHESPGAEARAIDLELAKLKTMGNVVVNTIAYSHYCDFSTLDRIANSGGGVCVRAQSISQVYEALYSTQRLLSGNMVPAAKFAIDNGDYIVAFSTEDRKILGGCEDLVVRGMSANANVQAYRITRVLPSMVKNAAVAGTALTAAFARLLLARGNILEAKYVVSGAGYRNLLNEHYRALTSGALGDFAQALDDVAFSGKELANEGPGLGFSGATVLDTLSVMKRHYGGVLVDLPALRAGYSRKGVKRVAGVRNDDGSITPPSTKLVTNADTWVKPSVTFNNSEATVQLQVALPSILATQDGTRIAEVAGVVLDFLKSYANYTVISDGSVNIPVLTIRVVTKAAHEAFTALGFDFGKFDPACVRQLEIGKMPVIDFSKSVGLESDTFGKLLTLSVYEKLGSAIAKALKTAGDGTEYTAEQIAALSANNITAAGYYSAPSTTPYTDVNDAVNAGTIDYRTAYKVMLGSTKTLHAGDLYSANAYLQRRFTLSVEVDGVRTDVAKPVFDFFFDPTAKWGIKKLSARTMLDEVDALMFPIFEAALGLADISVNTKLAGLLRNRDAVLSTLEVIENEVEALYSERIRPLVTYVSSTGIVPPALGFQPMTPDEFKTKYGVKPSSKEADGTFFVHPQTGNTLIVYPVLKPFSATPITDADD